MKQIDFDNNEQPKKESKFKAHLGFYLTLFICLSAVTFAVWTTYTSITDYMNPNKSNENLTTSEQSVEKNVSDAPYSNPSESNSQVNNNNNSSAVQNDNSIPNTDDTQKTNAVMSLLNNISKKYSADNPVYSATFKDWRVHNGIDIAVEVGSSIPCVADGTVKEVFNDELMGYSVKIEDKDGCTYIYNGLNKDITVKAGEAIKKGDIIGKSETVPSESADKPHIHISVIKNGKYVDPSNVL